MGELTILDDWDLQAVVRGCNNGEAFANIMMNDDNPSSLVSSFSLDQGYNEILGLPDLFDHGIQQEFDKPLIYPNDLQILSPNSILTTTSSVSIPSCKLVKEPERIPKDHLLFQSDTSASLTSDHSAMTGKSKRSRKNQQKREVKHVKADGLSSDMWAWRKYGQKPIKGSPYPRSYYRCSSLKGCLARKQVERSSSDPSMFIITYTAEHSHARPTRRNSLAGSTRIKSSVAKTTNKSDEPNMPTIKEECLDTVLPSSTTPLSMASANNHEDELVQHVKIKNEEEEEEQNMERSNASNEDIVMPDIIFSDELFSSLEDFEGLFLDHFSAPLP